MLDGWLSVSLTTLLRFAENNQFLNIIATWIPASSSLDQTNHTNIWNVGWLCWGLTSQSTIFQSCRDGAIASWVINQYFRGVKCLAQGHNTAAVGLEPRTSRSGVRHSTTEPPRSPIWNVILVWNCVSYTQVNSLYLQIIFLNFKIITIFKDNVYFL